MRLDAPERYREVDTADALAAVEGVADQWAQAATLPVPRPALDEVGEVVLAGVGGSAIAGDVVAAVTADRLGVRVSVHRQPTLPAHVDEGVLVVAISCSGETAETLALAEAALDRGAPLLAVAAGGRLGALCTARGAPWVQIHPTAPPRYSLGLLAAPVLAALGLADELAPAVAALREVVAAGGRHRPEADNPAKRLAARLAAAQAPPVVYGVGPLAGVAAYRLKCQLNEGAKLAVFSGTLPEAAHNELVAWQDSPAGGLVTLRDPTSESSLVAAEADAVEGLLGERLPWTERLVAPAGAPLARLAALLGLGDLVSVYTALALDRDPTPILLIDALKAQLAPPAGGAAGS